MIGEIGIGAFIVAWFGSLELRIRNHVGKERFNDLKDQTQRIEAKMDAMLIHNNLDPKTYDKE